MGPIDYRDLAARIQVPVNLLDLFQMSPDFAKQSRKLPTRINMKKKSKIAASELPKSTSSRPTPPALVQPEFTYRYDLKMPAESRLGPTTSATAAMASSHELLESTASISSSLLATTTQPLMPQIRSEDKAFRVPAVLSAMYNNVWKRVSLPLGTCQADQGSELNIVSLGLVRAVGYRPIALTTRGFSGLTMNTADGSASELTHFVRFKIEVLGISRTIDCFIRPCDRTADSKDIHLLLGLPWLHDVDVKMGIQDAQIEIGDKERGEKPVTI